MAVRLCQLRGREYRGHSFAAAGNGARTFDLRDVHNGGDCRLIFQQKANCSGIFVGESDLHAHRPLYEVIVEEARKRGMAGATVLRGVLGFGAHSRIHTAKVLRLSEDLPMVIEIVDTAERIEGFVPDQDKWIDEGMVTVEKVRVIAYRHREDKP